MDVFATYDKAASNLEDPNQFWTEIDDILSIDDWLDDRQEGSSSGQVYEVDSVLLQARLTSFLALCDAGYGEWVWSSSELAVQ